MDIYIYRYHTNLPISQEEAWQFFSEPKNMEIIQTIPPVRVTVTSKNIKVTVPLTCGLMSINTEILDISAPDYFVDRMEKPPYPFTFWEHRHQFQRNGNHTEMIDQVSFQAKWFPSILSSGLTQMFKTREKKLLSYFSS